MIQLTRAQHITLVMALAEVAGGKFKMLNGNIPAYITPDSNWTKLQAPGELDAVKLSIHLGIPITSIPNNLDRLGGAAIYKDLERLESIVMSQLGDLFLEESETERRVERVVKAFAISGAKMMTSRVAPMLKDIFSQHHSPKKIAAALVSLSGKVVWPDHHPRMSLAAPDKQDLIQRQGNAPLVKAEAFLQNVMLQSAKMYGDSPELFTTDVQSRLYSCNYALTLDQAPGSMVQLSPMVDYYLKDALMAFRLSGEVAFEAAAKKLQIEYRPIDFSKHTMTSKQGIHMARAVLEKAKTPEPNQQYKIEARERAEKRENGILEMSNSLALKLSLHKWSLALNQFAGMVSTDRRNAAKDKWLSITSKATNDAPSKVLMDVLTDVEHAFGDELTRQSHAIKSQIQGEVAERLSDEHNRHLCSAVTQFVNLMAQRWGQSPLGLFSGAVELKESLLNGGLNQLLEASKDLPESNITVNFIGHQFGVKPEVTPPTPAQVQAANAKRFKQQFQH